MLAKIAYITTLNTLRQLCCGALGHSLLTVTTTMGSAVIRAKWSLIQQGPTITNGTNILCDASRIWTTWVSSFTYVQLLADVWHLT
jgi:hypothetical protein